MHIRSKPRLRSIAWTLLLVPFLFLPYRWLWLPCGLAGTLVVWPDRLPLGERLRRDGTLVFGSVLALVIRTALDPALWLPWIAVMACLCVVRASGRWRRWQGYALVPMTWLAAVWLLIPPSEWTNRVSGETLLRPDARFVCAGDSLTAGVKVGDDSETYVGWLRARRSGKFINAGVASDRAADLLQRLDKTVLSHEPDVVLLFIGGNDYLDGTLRYEFAQTLEEIVSRVAESGVPIVLVEVPTGIVWNPYAGVYRRVASRYNAILVPESQLRWWYSIELLFRDRLAEPLTVDGIHLSPAGAARVARWLEPYLILAGRRVPHAAPLNNAT